MATTSVVPEADLSNLTVLCEVYLVCSIKQLAVLFGRACVVGSQLLK